MSKTEIEQIITLHKIIHEQDETAIYDDLNEFLDESTVKTIPSLISAIELIKEVIPFSSLKKIYDIYTHLSNDEQSNRLLDFMISNQQSFFPFRELLPENIQEISLFHKERLLSLLTALIQAFPDSINPLFDPKKGPGALLCQEILSEKNTLHEKALFLICQSALLSKTLYDRFIPLFKSIILVGNDNLLKMVTLLIFDTETINEKIQNSELLEAIFKHRKCEKLGNYLIKFMILNAEKLEIETFSIFISFLFSVEMFKKWLEHEKLNTENWREATLNALTFYFVDLFIKNPAFSVFVKHQNYLEILPLTKIESVVEAIKKNVEAAGLRCFSEKEIVKILKGEYQ